MKEQNHEAITSGQRKARTKRNRAPKNLPVLAWTSLPMLGHIRDFSGVGVAQPVWLHPSHRSPEIDDRNLAILQQENIAARAEALGCRFDSSQREVNGQKVWFMAFVEKSCAHAKEQLKLTESGMQCECGKQFESSEPIVYVSSDGNIPPE